MEDEVQAKMARIFTAEDVKYLYENKTKLWWPSKEILVELQHQKTHTDSCGNTIVAVRINISFSRAGAYHEVPLNELRTVAGEVYPDNADTKPHTAPIELGELRDPQYPEEEAADATDVTLTLRKGVVVTVTGLPGDLTPAEAERLCMVIRAQPL